MIDNESSNIKVPKILNGGQFQMEILKKADKNPQKMVKIGL